MSHALPYLGYSDDLETPFPDEARIVSEIVAHMGATQRRNADHHRHAHRDAHAKSHAVLKGTLRVLPDLPAELAQGIFVPAREYDVVARLSSAPGDVRTDDVPEPLGFAFKVLGVDGERLSPNISGTNQDFLLVNIPVLAFGDVGKYQQMLQILEKKAAAPETLQRLGAAAARGMRTAVEAVSGTANATLQGLAQGRGHILGETFHSQGALRFGDYIAKISLTPLDAVAALTGQDIASGHSAMRDAVRQWFATRGAHFAVNAQLCTDRNAMPVEDAAVLWDPKVSPHRQIGDLIFAPQPSYSPARQIYGDDHLSFNPWNGVVAHRPLGSIMRVRRVAYEQSSEQRHRLNALPRQEPAQLKDVPD